MFAVLTQHVFFVFQAWILMGRVLVSNLGVTFFLKRVKIINLGTSHWSMKEEMDIIQSWTV